MAARTEAELIDVLRQLKDQMETRRQGMPFWDAGGMKEAIGMVDKSIASLVRAAEREAKDTR
jgi:hypothetical protein